MFEFAEWLGSTPLSVAIQSRLWLTPLLQTIFPIEGRSTPVSPGTVIEYKVPDMYGRPWAQIWEEYWEKDMEKPEDEDIFSFD